MRVIAADSRDAARRRYLATSTENVQLLMLKVSPDVAAWIWISWEPADNRDAHSKLCAAMNGSEEKTATGLNAIILASLALMKQWVVSGTGVAQAAEAENLTLMHCVWPAGTLITTLAFGTLT